MKAEILSIGHELLMGEIVDTNAAYLASQLPRLGVELQWVTQVGDDQGMLIEAFRRAFSRSDLVLCTGGLGPTQDDLTREAIAETLGEEMTVQPELRQHLEEYFRKRNIEMPARNLKQATLIPSAHVIPNARGTAPGWWAERNGHVIIAMPGPPGELMEMWQEQVLPELRKRVGTQVIVSRNIKTTGLSEAAVADMAAQWFGKENPYLGIYAKPDGIYLRFLARADSEEAARELIRPGEAAIYAVLKDYIWGYDDETPETTIGPLLREKRLKLGVMESCTGGMLASTITDVPGSSDYFVGGLITYTAELKVAYGVPAALIQKHGVISQEVADAMAQAARKRLNADIGIGVTGVAGPAEVEGKQVGTVHVAIAMGDKTHQFPLRLPPRRELVKARAVTTALIQLARLLRTG